MGSIIVMLVYRIHVSFFKYASKKFYEEHTNDLLLRKAAKATTHLLLLKQQLRYSRLC